jgi:hypothetical protein
LPGEDQFFGFAGGNQARQALGAGVAGEDAQGYFRQANLGIFSDHTDIAGQGQFHAATEGKSVNCGDNRGGEISDLLEHFLAAAAQFFTVFAVQLGKFGDICPGDKGFVAATGYRITQPTVSSLASSAKPPPGHQALLVQGVYRRAVNGDNA